MSNSTPVKNGLIPAVFQMSSIGKRGGGGGVTAMSLEDRFQHLIIRQPFDRCIGPKRSHNH